VCERGIRTLKPIRAYMDISASDREEALSPSHRRRSVHGTGRRDKVAAMGRAAIARGQTLLLKSQLS